MVAAVAVAENLAVPLVVVEGELQDYRALRGFGDTARFLLTSKWQSPGNKFGSNDRPHK